MSRPVPAEVERVPGSVGAHDDCPDPGVDVTRRVATNPRQRALPGRDAQTLSRRGAPSHQRLGGAAGVPPIGDEGLFEEACRSGLEKPKDVVDVLRVAELGTKTASHNRRIPSDHHAREDVIDPESPERGAREPSTRVDPNLPPVLVHDDAAGMRARCPQVGRERCALSLQLFRPPEVIVVEQRDIVTGATESARFRATLIPGVSSTRTATRGSRLSSAARSRPARSYQHDRPRSAPRGGSRSGRAPRRAPLRRGGPPRRVGSTTDTSGPAQYRPAVVTTPDSRRSRVPESSRSVIRVADQSTRPPSDSSAGSRGVRDGPGSPPGWPQNEKNHRRRNARDAARREPDSPSGSALRPDGLEPSAPAPRWMRRPPARTRRSQIWPVFGKPRRSPAPPDERDFPMARRGAQPLDLRVVRTSLAERWPRPAHIGGRHTGRMAQRLSRIFMQRDEWS